MLTLENLLVRKLVGKRLVDKTVSNAKIILDDNDGRPYLYFQLEGKDRKINIQPLIKDSVTDAYATQVWASMLSDGYTLGTLPGGWVCFTPDGDHYEMTDNTCSCQAFNHDSSRPCKHLLFKRGELLYRARSQRLVTRLTNIQKPST
jgi:hypothetical protein